MAQLKLAMAMYPYDRVRALEDGTVRPEGIDLTFVALPVGATFWRQLHHRPEFEVSELSLSGYIVTLESAPSPFVAIPVFPSRTFRHSAIFVNDAIREPGDLAGARIGVPDYSMTAGVWVRGMLQEEHGVDPRRVRWIRGGLDAPGADRLPTKLSNGISVEEAPPGQTLSAMLATRELDAVISPEPPACFIAQAPGVRRLFEDWEAAERAYYTRSRLFPIMHTVAIRRETYEQNRWIAASLYAAFERAKALCYDRLVDQLPVCSIPWAQPAFLERWRFFGGDPFAYGLDANRRVLDTLTRYLFEQGLTRRRFAVDELFAPEAVDVYAPAAWGEQRASLTFGR
jgi:4,5-dihydroxyphthalate decarboxylase